CVNMKTNLLRQLGSSQVKKAFAILQKIEGLEKKLAGMIGENISFKAGVDISLGEKKKKSRGGKRNMSAAGRARIAAAQKKRWSAFRAEAKK
ncbi:MAG: hypothetical protein SFY92_04505, partial [Verrucomicrobiae bacterium]|nr:hypothetical protein [Verrucomicrobiae bacterium]